MLGIFKVWLVVFAAVMVTKRSARARAVVSELILA